MVPPMINPVWEDPFDVLLDDPRSGAELVATGDSLWAPAVAVSWVLAAVAGVPD